MSVIAICHKLTFALPRFCCSFLALLRYASAKDCGERCDLLGKRLGLMQGCRDAGMQGCRGDKKNEAHHRQVMGLCLSCEGAD